MLVRIFLLKGISAPNRLQTRLRPAGPWQREVKKPVFSAPEAAENLSLVFMWEFLSSDSTGERTTPIHNAVAAVAAVLPL